MKTKIFVLLAAVALLTFSFSFTQLNSAETETVVAKAIPGSEPVGGFAAVEISK